MAGLVVGGMAKGGDMAGRRGSGCGEKEWLHGGGDKARVIGLMVW
jgi:hypothetical protein